MQLSEIKLITGNESNTDKRTFTVLPYSPVFIGSGMSMRKGLDFYSSRGKTHLFDHQKIYKHYLDDIDSLEQALLKGTIESFITEKGHNPTEFIKQSMTGDVLGLELMQPLTDGFGNPILPGSSLKGSIRTALFANLFESNNLPSSVYENLIKGKRGVSAKSLETELLSTQKGGKAPNFDIGRALRISDASFKYTDIEVFNAVVVNQTNRGYEYKIMGQRGSNTPYLNDATIISVAALSFDSELVKPAEVSVSIDQNSLKNINWKFQFDFTYIANTCNQLSKRLMKFELAYFEEAEQDLELLKTIRNEYKLLLEDLNECEADTKNGNPCWIQRVAIHAGFKELAGDRDG